MRIMIVDDDNDILNSLDIIFSSQKDFEVCGKYSNGQQAVDNIHKADPEIVLMDIRMPHMDGIQATRHIKKHHPHIKVVMLTTFKDFSNVHQALNAGANGYLLKTDDFQKQVDTLKSVYAGHKVFSEEAYENLSKSSFDDSDLTPREKTIVELIAHGYQNKEISQRLFISEGTIRNTISVILDKLYLRDRTQIAIYYWKTKSH